MEEAKEEEIKTYKLIDKYAFITAKAIKEQYIGYCYREHTEIKIDSGWRFIMGDEDDAYLDNPDNCFSMDLSEIITIFPQVKEIMEEKYNSEWVWNDEVKRFVLLEQNN